MFVYNQEPGPHFFSMPLKKYNGKVPFILTTCIDQLNITQAELREGVFRIPSSKDNFNTVCRSFDKGNIPKEQLPYEKNMADSVLKRYLHNLSYIDPLIPAQVTDKILQINFGTPEESATILHTIFQEEYSKKLTHRATLSTLFNYLDKKIIPNIQHNQMDSSALATCLSPVLFPQHFLLPEQLPQFNILKQSVEIMINQFPIVFEENWYSPENYYRMTDEEIERLSIAKVDLQAAEIERDRREIQKQSMIPFKTQNPMLLEVFAKRTTRTPPPIPE